MPTDKGAKIIDWAIGDSPLNEAGVDSGLAAAIGNFDGVHLGHQALISQAVQGASAKNLNPAVIIFAPHPRRFFKPDDGGFALADEEDKIALLARLGVKWIIRLKFDKAMKNTSAEDFIAKVLPALGIKALYAGKDFAFGNDRSGTMEMVAKIGADFGLTAHGVDLVESTESQEGGVISSSRIRKLIASGEVKDAAELLGRPYVISGVVIKGDERGREIGFPTANINPEEMMLPRFGVYVVAARLADRPKKPIYEGIANIGIRPSVNNRGVLLESHLFNFDDGLYGERLQVFMLDFVRAEKAFNNLDGLKQQIAQDVKTAQDYHQIKDASPHG